MAFLIDTRYCSSYYKDTLVEISAGFDGLEGGIDSPYDRQELFITTNAENLKSI